MNIIKTLMGCRLIAGLVMLGGFATLSCLASDAPGLGPELLANGKLADGDMGWTLQTLQGANGSLAVLEKGYDGKPALIVTAEATETSRKLWTIQLAQNGLSFKKGIKYRLTFAAKSSDGKWSYVTLGETVPPYGTVCKGSQIMLSDSWQVFSYDFTVAKDAPEARLVFTNLNDPGQTRSFADISLREIK